MDLTYKDYLAMEKFPHIWCSGCGNGIILQCIARALADLKLDLDKVVVVTGIGCWGKADDYFNTSTFHGTHGRALAFATGIKLARPELKVIVLMGDGDGVTIGGNHFIHAARRNIDLTAIVANNFNYGMTGGQYSGTTPIDSITATSRYGHLEPQFDICRLAVSAGASFVARECVANPMSARKLIKEAIDFKGFSLVEMFSPCPTHFGRNNKLKTPSDMLDWLKAQTVRTSNDKVQDFFSSHKYVIGKIHREEKEDYSSKYAQLIDSLKEVNINE